MALWIESHAILLRHRKTRRLAAEIGTERVIALGMLHAFWHNVIEQQEDGNLEDWTPEMVADAFEVYSVRKLISFKGTDSDFLKILQKIKLLDGMIVHDWLDYVGRLLRQRYAKRNKKRLIDIWKIHGKNYGEDTRKINGQLNVN